MPVILASSSPRRKQILSMLGLNDFRVIHPDIQESHYSLPPHDAVTSIAEDKARFAALLCNHDDIIIAADTLVFIDDAPLGKPRSPDDAFRMLKLLSGNSHLVYTGIAVSRGDILISQAESTRVFFRHLSDSEITDYIRSREPLDKAGAYAAQGRGAMFVSRIEGDFFNVMGLPACRLALMLRYFGLYL